MANKQSRLSIRKWRGGKNIEDNLHSHVRNRIANRFGVTPTPSIESDILKLIQSNRSSPKERISTHRTVHGIWTNQIKSWPEKGRNNNRLLTVVFDTQRKQLVTVYEEGDVE